MTTRIVIVGAGFGGIFCARGLARAAAQVTLIDRQNHHAFQPLLYQVATGFLGINDVALPIRGLFRNDTSVTVAMDEVTGVDLASRRVLAQSKEYSYDYLVLAPGARYHFFGRDAWAEHAQVLKTMEDAITLRQKILSSFEHAEQEEDDAARRALLTYVIIGGGPTGVEMAGAIADVVNYALAREFRRIRKEDVRILLLEAGPRILSGMPEKLSAYSQGVLEKKGVVVRCGEAVKDIRAGCVVAGETIESATILWAAGVKPSPLVSALGIPTDKRGGIAVNENLSVPGHPDIFVLGDAATFLQDGKPLPALASVAKQQGQYLAKLLQRRIAGNHADAPFRYRDYGSMATIGRNGAVADFGFFTVKGWLAWITWGIVHIYFLTGFRNRVAVFLTWLWTYLTYGMGARILLRVSPVPRRGGGESAA